MSLLTYRRLRFVVVIALCLLIFFLLSPLPLRLLWAYYAPHNANYQLSIERIEGNLIRGYRLKNVSIATPVQQLTVKTLFMTASWQGIRFASPDLKASRPFNQREAIHFPLHLDIGLATQRPITLMLRLGDDRHGLQVSGDYDRAHQQLTLAGQAYALNYQTERLTIDNFSGEGRLSMQLSSSHWHAVIKTQADAINHQPHHSTVIIEHKDGQWQIDRLHIQLGHTTLQGAGQLSKQSDLKLRVSGHVADIMLEGSGTFKGDITFDGNVHDQLHHRAHFSAQHVRWQDYALKHLRVHSERDKTFQLSADCAHAMLYGTPIKHANLRLHEQNAIMQLSATAQSMQTRVAFNAHGRWRHELAIDSLSINRPHAGHWLLNKPVLINAHTLNQGNHLVIKQLNDSGLIVLTAKHTSPEWHFAINAHQFHHLLMPTQLSTQLSLNGDSKLAMSLQLDKTKPIKIDATLTLNRAALQFVDSRWPPLKFKNGSVSLHVVPGKVQQSSTLTIDPKHTIQQQLTLVGFEHIDWQQLAHSKLQGHVQVDSNNLDYISALFPGISETKGRIKADIALSGSLNAPEWQGYAQVIDGSLHILDTGTRIHAIQAQWRANNKTPGYLELNAQLGEGQLSVRGPFNPRFADLHVTGNDLLVQNTSEIRLTVSPMLTIKRDKKSIAVIGAITINDARVTPRDFNQAINTSPDVVVQSTGTEQSASLEHIPLFMDIVVKLEKPIPFRGFNMQAALDGNLHIVKQRQSAPTATGAIHIKNGVYRLYGQSLSIANGRLAFLDSPLDNPGLAIRATRQVNISNNNDVTIRPEKKATVGVQISGNLSRPIVKLFSRPALPEYEILSYLALGVASDNIDDAQNTLLTGIVNDFVRNQNASDISNPLDKIASAVSLDALRISTSTDVDRTTGKSESHTNLVVGKSLSPSLYFKYSIGLFDPVSVFQLQWRLSRRWRLQTETTSEGNAGSDIIYSLEKR